MKPFFKRLVETSVLLIMIYVAGVLIFLPEHGWRISDWEILTVLLVLNFFGQFYIWWEPRR